MAVMELWRRRDLEGMVQTEYLPGNFFSLDADGNLIGVTVYQNGAPAALSGSVTGYCVLPDGTTVAVAGTRSGNKAYMTVPQSALGTPGPLGIVMKLIDGNTITTLLSVVATVYRSRTDTVITPSQQIITDWANAISEALQEVEDASAEQDAKIDDINSAVSYQIIEGEYIALNGTIQEHENFKRTELVPCHGATTVKYIGTSSNTNVFVIAFYKADKTYLSGSGKSNTGESGTLLETPVPEGAYYACVCALMNQKILVSFEPSIMCAMGDTLYYTKGKAEYCENEIGGIESENGVLARWLQPYEKTWNLWDGSWGLAKNNPITGAAVNYIVYGPVISVTAGDYYSLGVVDNPLYGTVNVLSCSFYNANGDRISAQAVYQRGGYLTWVQVPEGATRLVPYYNTNDGAVSITVEQIKAANYKWIIANRLVNYSSQDSQGQYAFSESEWIPSYMQSPIYNGKAVTHIVTVGASNSDFTSLRAAVDAIVENGDASETNRYEIQIKEGTYDISSYYSSTEKADEHYIGLVVPDWVTLKGVGNRTKTILKYELDTASSHICVLNLQNTCGLENLTLYGLRTRYCVHDDKADTSGAPYTRYCRNVHFKGDTMTYGAVYGAGIKSNAEWTFENCIFESLTEAGYQNCFSVHGSQVAQIGSNYVNFINCRFIGHGSVNNALILSTLMDTARYIQNYCSLHGCSANGRLVLREEDASEYGAGIAWWATGYATTFTDVIINHTDSEDYSANVDII